MTLDDIEFNQSRRPAPQHVTGGQPSAKQLELAAQAGIQHVINLRPPEEDAGFDEESQLAALGVTSCRVPVNGGAGLTADNVRAFHAALKATQDQPTLIHCAGGNRVGAMMALRAGWILGHTLDESMAIGKAYGLAGLEPAVRALLAGRNPLQ